MAKLEIDGHLGIIRFGGKLSHARALGVLDEALADDRFMASATYLWDFSGTELSLDTSQTRALAEQYRERVPRPPHRRKVALVADNAATRATLMILRSLLRHAGRSEYQLFEREAAARLWLSVRPQWTDRYPVLGNPAPA